MKKVAVLNTKGGVGKTTTAFMMAWCAAQHGLRVLVQDADPQGSLTTWVSHATQGDSPVNVLGFDFQTVHEDLLRGRHHDYDLIITDTAPGYSELLEVVLETSDLVIIPTMCEPSAIDRVLPTVRSAHYANKKHAVLLTKVQMSARLGITGTQQFCADNDIPICTAVIPSRVALGYTFGQCPDQDYGYDAVGTELGLW